MRRIIILLVLIIGLMSSAGCADSTFFYGNYTNSDNSSNINNANVLAGEKIFMQTGCQKCHIPSYVTGNQTVGKLNHGQKIAPYTDLLLHDMGEGLADQRPEGAATGQEWRTAPLWGIGFTSSVSGCSHFLHDGRARNVLEAILWHGGEAQAQRDAVMRLDRTKREQLVAFIESL